MAWICRLRGHRWTTEQGRDGTSYQVCERCGHHPGRHSWLEAAQQERLPTDHFPGSGGASGGIG